MFFDGNYLKQSASTFYYLILKSMRILHVLMLFYLKVISSIYCTREQSALFEPPPHPGPPPLGEGV
jgi:hypothetical protein